MAPMARLLQINGAAGAGTLKGGGENLHHYKIVFKGRWFLWFYGDFTFANWSK